MIDSLSLEGNNEAGGRRAASRTPPTAKRPVVCVHLCVKILCVKDRHPFPMFKLSPFGAERELVIAVKNVARNNLLSFIDPGGERRGGSPGTR